MVLAVLKVFEVKFVEFALAPESNQGKKTLDASTAKSPIKPISVLGQKLHLQISVPHPYEVALPIKKACVCREFLASKALTSFQPFRLIGIPSPSKTFKLRNMDEKNSKFARMTESTSMSSQSSMMKNFFSAPHLLSR